MSRGSEWYARHKDERTIKMGDRMRVLSLIHNAHAAATELLDDSIVRVSTSDSLALYISPFPFACHQVRCPAFTQSFAVGNFGTQAARWGGTFSGLVGCSGAFVPFPGAG